MPKIEILKEVPKSYLDQKAKNQLVLDKAIEDEFNQTMQMFDLFV